MGAEEYTPEQILAAIDETNGVIVRAARILGCTRTTIYRYAKNYESVDACIKSYRSQPKSARGTVFTPSDTPPLFAQISEETYTEDGLRDRFSSTAPQWCRSLGLPEPEAVCPEIKLDGVRFDIVLHHANSVTIVEVKRKRERVGARCEYLLPGQLLYYRRALLDSRLIETETVNLVAAIDWEPSERFLSTLEDVYLHIHLVSTYGLHGLR